MEYRLNDAIGYLISVVYGNFRNEIYHLLAPYEITPGQWVVLTRLVDGDGKTQKQLADETLKDEPNIGRILKHLERKGYIYRSQDAKDKRMTIVLITEKGRQFSEQLLPLVIDYPKRLLQGLSEDEILTLKSILEKLVNFR